MFLKQEDVIAAGVLDMEKALQDVERSFLMHGRGEVRQPTKTLLDFPDPERGERGACVVAMPVYIGGEIERAGIKWAAESLANARRGDLPYGIDLVILHDLERALPVAIMDGTLITAMRTAAATGVAAKYLARPNSRVAGLVGTGVIGRTTLEALLVVLPSLDEVRLFDLKPEKARALANEFGEGVEIRRVESARQAIEGADLFATMTTTRQPFVKAGWMKEGSLFAQVGGNESEEAVILNADRLVVDDWEPIKHYEASLFCRLYKEGRIKDEDVVNLREIVVGRKPGRRSEKERIVFKPFGLACEDIMLAERIYQQAQTMGLGERLLLWERSKWL
ncbi:MAG: ornithine cyclodeaminase family protein [Candidatus Bipolaricaulia bacterium]